MKQVHYLLKDEIGTVRARWVLPEGETPVMEPWMRMHAVERGWRVEAWEGNDSGVQIHGWADWQGVADTLATVLRVFLSDDGFDSEEQAEAFLDQARAALDDYHLAQMEVVMAGADAEPQTSPPADPPSEEP